MFLSLDPFFRFVPSIFNVYNNTIFAVERGTLGKCFGRCLIAHHVSSSHINHIISSHINHISSSHINGARREL